MTIRLAVQETPWVAHVQSTARSYPGLVPVVKGNGYGFRRWNLVPLAGQLAEEIAVGTVFEIRGVPDHVTPIVLTPTMCPLRAACPTGRYSPLPLPTISSPSTVRDGKGG